MMKGRVFLIVVLMMMSLLAVLPAISDEADASTIDSFNPNIIDDLYCSDANYYKALWGDGSTGVKKGASGPSAFVVGQEHTPTTHAVIRGFLSFDTSSIPDDFEPISAELSVRAYQCPQETVNVEAYNVNFGNTLDTTKADFTVNGTYEGIIVNSTYCVMNNIYRLDVLPENIDKTGNTQYKLVANSEGNNQSTVYKDTVYFYKNFGFLNITLKTGTAGIINYTFAMGNGTNHSSIVYPVEIINWNNTHEQMRYEIYLLNESYAHFSVNNSYTFQSIHPNCTVNNLGNGVYNLTNSYIDFEWYHLWFLREKTVTESDLHIQLWHSTLGEGIPDWKWKCVINQGMAYNNLTAEWIYNLDNWHVEYGYNYTITVLDFFDNILTSYHFTASTYDINLLIPIDIYTFQVVNFRQGGSTLVSIYFNATGDPYTHSVPADSNWYFPIRSGDYQILVTYLYWNNATQSETVGAGYSYNVTIDADYNFYVGESFISITKYTVDGMEVDIDTIVTWTAPSLIIIPNDPALVPTEDCGLNYENNLPIYLDPYYVITAEMRFNEDNVTGDATLDAGELDTALMSGNVIFLMDNLRISASNTSATMIVNDTDTGTELINTTAPSGTTYDIVHDYYSHRGNALTVWVSNGAFSITRDIRYRQSQVFYWEVRSGGNYHTCTITVNNTQSDMIFEPNVYVAFHNDTNPDLDRVNMYDSDNNIWLEKGIGYKVDSTGVSFMFTNLTSGTVRTFAINYWVANATEFGEAWIDPSNPQWYNYQNKQMRYVQGTYRNNEQSTFEGVVKFSLDFSEADHMDRGSIIVMDLGNDLVLTKHSHYRVTDSAIEIMSNYVGQIETGESLSIGVLYDRSDDTTTSILTDDIIAGLSLPYLMIIIASGLIVLGLLVRQSKKFKDESKAWINTGITIIIVLIGLVVLVLSVSNA